MARKIFRIGLVAAVISVLAAVMSSDISASVCPCGTPRIYGTVTMGSGNPPPANTTTVHFRCVPNTGCEPSNDFDCLIDNGNGQYNAWLGAGGDCSGNGDNGTWDIWATSIAGDC